MNKYIADFFFTAKISDDIKNIPLIRKIRFIKFLKSKKIKNSRIYGEFILQLGFDQNSNIFQSMLKISNCKDELLNLFEAKNFSLKQCSLLLSYPKIILDQILNWHKELNLSASLILELADSLNIILRRKKQSLAELINQPEMQRILNSELTTQEKISSLRTYLWELKYPSLKKVHDKIKALEKNLEIPSQIKFGYDKNLELKELNFHVKIKDIEEINKISTFFKKNRFILKKILNKL